MRAAFFSQGSICFSLCLCVLTGVLRGKEPIFPGKHILQSEDVARVALSYAEENAYGLGEALVVLSEVFRAQEVLRAREPIFARRHIFHSEDLTRQRGRDALQVALSYAEENVDKLGVALSDIEGLELKRRYTTEHNGVTHLKFQQVVSGIPVSRGRLNVNVLKNGHILNVGSNLFPRADLSFNTVTPAVPAELALTSLAGKAKKENEGSAYPSVEVVEGHGGPTRRMTLKAPAFARDEVRAELTFYPVAPGQLRLAWSLGVRLRDESGAFEGFVDATNGTELARESRTVHATPDYEVLPLDVESPADGLPEEVEPEPTDPPNLIASPKGWTDQPVYPYTSGNNVIAKEGSYQPNGGILAKFIFPGDDPLDLPTLDASLDLSTYRDKAITNLFFTCNAYHDIFYQYGFNEAAGNFQEDNFGRGGEEDDPLIALRTEIDDGNGAKLVWSGEQGISPELQMGSQKLQEIKQTVVSAPTGAANAVAIAAADIDGDGDLDLVTANEDSDNLSVFRNDPAPAFEVDFSHLVNVALPTTASKPADVIAADVDGDGDQDLVTANQMSASDHDISVFLNNGGQFSLAGSASVSPGEGPVSLAAGDFHLPGGNIDLAVACKESDHLVILLDLYASHIQNPGSPDQILDLADASIGGEGPVAVIHSDLAGTSSLLPLAVAFEASENVAVFESPYLLNAFNHVGTFCLPGAATSLTAADFDGDDDEELAVTCATSVTENDVVAILENISLSNFIDCQQTCCDGDGTELVLVDVGFGAQAVVATATASSGNTIPLTLDGALADLLIANSSSTAGTSNTVSVRLDRGTIAQPKISFSGPKVGLGGLNTAARSELPLDLNGPRALIAAHLNGDTQFDAVVAYATDPVSVGILVGQSTAPAGGTFFADGDQAIRDNAIDRSYVAHEWSHALHWALAGKPLDANEQGGSFGEGLADFFALALTQTDADHSAHSARGMFTFWQGGPPEGFGVRTMAYSRNNPLTYEAFNERQPGGLCNSPHCRGEIWASTLWDMYWALCDEYPPSNNLYLNGKDPGAGGDNIALQLVVDALKLLDPDPSFVSFRDAILLADVANYGGRNLDLLWSVFAHRGLGWCACDNSTDPTADPCTDPCSPYVPTTTGEVNENFDLPPLGTIGGFVRDDLFQGLQGWKVYLDLNVNGELDPEEDTSEFTQTTDSSGAYQFTGLYPRTYFVAVDLQAGWEATFPVSPLGNRVGKWPRECDTDCSECVSNNPTGDGCCAPDGGETKYADVWGEGDFAYVGSSIQAGVDIIDISDPENPRLASHWDYDKIANSAFNEIEDVEVHNGIGFFASNNGGGVFIVDVTNPLRPEDINQVAGADGGRDHVHTLTVVGDYLYIASDEDGNIPVFNVSDPALPFKVMIPTASDEIETGASNVHQCTVEPVIENGQVTSTRLYACKNNGYVQIYDVSNLHVPSVSLLGSLPAYTLDSVHSCWPTADGKYLVVAKESASPTPWGNQVDIWDISGLPWWQFNPPPTSPVASVSLPASEAGSAHNPVVDGNLLYVSWYQAGLLVFDITDPTSPAQIGRYDTFCGDGSGPGIYTGNWGVYPGLGPDRILASDTLSGLYILRNSRTYRLQIAGQNVSGKVFVVQTN